MISYIDLANIVLRFGSYSNKKLQKLSYYLYSWHITIYKEKISDINFEAWVHGPVCPQIYDKYRLFGWQDIPRHEGYLCVNDEVMDFSGKILRHYSIFSADELEELTHNEEPWIKARGGISRHEPCTKKISDHDILHYYFKSDLYHKFSTK